jgi:hypothetical protein
MIRYLKKLVSRRIESCVRDTMWQYRDELSELAAASVPEVYILDRIRQVQADIDLEPVVERVLDRVKTGSTVEYESLAECIDREELAKQFDTADLAGDMDYSSLASEVDLNRLAEEFDLSDVAGEIDVASVASAFDEDSIADRVAESLDYKRLAKALLAEVAAR